MAAELEAVSSGQHHIQKKKRRQLASGFGEYGGATDETLHLESGCPQVVRDQAGYVSIVFYHKDERTKRAGTPGACRFLVGFGWQVHAFASGLPEVHCPFMIARVRPTLLGQCCANVSLLLMNDEFAATQLLFVSGEL
jgi:hypothetical protein